MICKKIHKSTKKSFFSKSRSANHILRHPVCKSLPTHSTAAAIFDALSEFIVSNGIDWSKCVGINTNGTHAKLGQYSKLVTQVKAVAPQVKAIHCSIHREALATKKMSAELKTVLDEAVQKSVLSRFMAYLQFCG